MKFGETLLGGRKAWKLDNGAATLVMLAGGGHIASLTLNEKPAVNPLWVPVWKPVEPWQYAAKHAKTHTSKLLGAIAGHNVCLGWFGEPSPEEAAAGMECHGEAPVAKWRLVRKALSGGVMTVETECELPVVGMVLKRTISTQTGKQDFHVTDTVRNVSQRDIPFTICEHVTFGPPFLQKGETVFDMPAVQSHTFRGQFSDKQRLRPNAPFAWPRGPGRHGEMVDMRTIGNSYGASSDFSTQLIDPKRPDGWFTAVNAELGVLVAYTWRRKDFPWVGNWEENYGRKTRPWGGRSLARGMEFANSPFPVGLRKATEMAHFQGHPTFRWVPALTSIDFSFDIVITPVAEEVKGVKDMYRTSTGFAFDFITG
ncbi:MAG: hypothetical protein C0404_11560 [Verrucomicrobia bacterium]|nr:hypothetical protein [Verrucomicrobiota bacterium]